MSLYNIKPTVLPTSDALATIAAILQRDGDDAGMDVKSRIQQAFELWETAAEFLARKQNYTARCEDSKIADAAKLRAELGGSNAVIESLYALEGTKHWPKDFPATFSNFSRKILKAKTTLIAKRKIRPYILSLLKRRQSIEFNKPIHEIPEPPPEIVDTAIQHFVDQQFDQREWNQAGIECLKLLEEARSKKARLAANARHRATTTKAGC